MPFPSYRRPIGIARIELTLNLSAARLFHDGRGPLRPNRLEDSHYTRREQMNTNENWARPGARARGQGSGVRG